jgi:hypothetical protein
MEDIYLTVDTTELDEALCKASMLADIIGSPYVKKLLNMNENELNKLKAKHKRAGKYIAALKKNEDSFLYEIEMLREEDSRLARIIASDKKTIANQQKIIDKQNRQVGHDYASQVGYPCNCNGGNHGPTE